MIDNKFIISFARNGENITILVRKILDVRDASG